MNLQAVLRVLAAMRITQFNSNPLVELRYLNAGRRPSDFYVDQLPIFHATVDELPESIDALLVTADLQGLETLRQNPTHPPRLLGESLPEQLEFILDELHIQPSRVAAFLAGDLYTYPDLRGRGGTGDVSTVWQSFADNYGWVIGVAGNHDLFGESQSRLPNWNGPVKFALDGSEMDLHGMRVAGVSGVVGNPRKNFRRAHPDYLEIIELLLDSPTDILVLHDGPDTGTKGYRGIPELRELVLEKKPSLVIRGHSHWPKPFVQLSEDVQILNVDATVAILTRGH